MTHRIYYIIGGYIDIEAKDAEAACDMVEHMNLNHVIDNSKDVTIECEYTDFRPEPEYEHEDKIERNQPL